MNEKAGADKELVATVRKRKLQYFGYMIRAQNLCTYSASQNSSPSKTCCNIFTCGEHV